jgi:hypothetical protein
MTMLASSSASITAIGGFAVGYSGATYINKNTGASKKFPH